MPDQGLKLTINGYDVEARKGELVIDAAERAGVFIPRFCYHPRMKPVGMCRMCIVDIDTGRGPALQPSCMIPVADGMVVDTESPATKKAQDGVLEFLLINHPLDCPVCDRGGECPLQDNAYAYGPGESRFVEEKRHYAKPIPISDLVLLDRERCILCDRCTRFSADVAGDPLISFLDRGGQMQVNTFPDHPFASYFSGNTVQLCPVGALLARPYRFKARPWDLEKAESTCTTCSFGCRVTEESTRNHVVRRQGVDLDPVNWGWLCDKGRFSWEAIESEGRLAVPMCRQGDALAPVGWSAALTSAVEALSVGPERIGVIGGSRLTNEAAYAWSKLAKGILGTDNVDCQLGDGLPADVVFGLPRATIDDACAEGGTVLLLAPDLKEELPVLFLRLRDAVVEHGVEVVELSPIATSMTPLAAASVRYLPGEAGVAAAALLDEGAPAADILRRAERLTVVLGRPSLAEGESTIVDAVAALLDSFPEAHVLTVLRRANVHGALDMGLTPGLLPGHVTLDEGREWFTEAGWNVPASRGLDTAAMLTAAAAGELDTLVLLGADPLADFPDHDLAARALEAVSHVVAVDTHRSASVERATVVLPSAGQAEVSGTTTNIEGRVLTVAQKVTPPGTARADWQLAAELAYRLGADLGIESVEGAWEEIERVAPSYAGITAEVLEWGAARDGVLMPLDPDHQPELEGIRVTIASQRHGIDTESAAAAGAAAAAESDQDRQAAELEAKAEQSEHTGAEDAARGARDTRASAPPRPALLSFARPAQPTELPRVDAYGLRLVATRTLYDRGTLVSNSPSLRPLSAEAALRMNDADLGRLGLTSGDRVTVGAPTGRKVELTAVAHPGVPKGVAAMIVNHDGADPAELIDITSPVTTIQVDTR